MPAVELTRLNTEIEILVRKFTRPAEFQSNLDELLSRFGTPSMRSSSSDNKDKHLQSYNTNPLVIQTLKHKLLALCEENPKAGLRLATVIWEDKHYEMRSLAAFIMGLIPSTLEDLYLPQISKMASIELPVRMLDELFQIGTTRFRRENSEGWLSLVESWVSSQDIKRKNIGLRGLIPLINDDVFINTPAIFRLLSSFLVSPKDTQLVPLTLVFMALASHEPVETSHFLRQQIINQTTHQQIIHMIRRLLPQFPEPIQDNLKKTLREHRHPHPPDKTPR